MDTMLFYICACNLFNPDHLTHAHKQMFTSSLPAVPC